ncbi:MAG: hypothetical protein U0792_23285 [Gemmataceae bacterium]
MRSAAVAWGNYLLVGPDGVGKRLFAHELAKALLCERPPAPLTACDSCPACAQVEAETHPDFHGTPKGKQELPVDEMRAFCTQLAKKPSRGSRIVGIVEDADDFNAESANSFLKTLEEPPPGALLLLIAGIDRQPADDSQGARSCDSAHCLRQMSLQSSRKRGSRTRPGIELGTALGRKRVPGSWPSTMKIWRAGSTHRRHHGRAAELPEARGNLGEVCRRCR